MAQQYKIKKKKLGAYPSASVVFSTTLSLVIFGFFALVLVFGNQLSTAIRENIEIQVFLEKDISLAQKRQVQAMLNNGPYALNENVVNYTSREEAAQQFIEETGEDFMQFLGENPLRDVFTVKIAQDYQTDSALFELKSELELVEGVYEVTYVENLAEEINANITKAAIILISITILLVFIVIILINNTIKLALFSQRFLIRSMQLVGATGSFIRKPFISRAFLQGLLAGVLAGAALAAMLFNASRNIEEMSSFFELTTVAIILAAVMLAGVVISTLSAARAVNRYLNMSLDDLY